MDRQRFEAIVWEVVEDLPAFFKEKLENVMVIVEDLPNEEIQAEFGNDMLFGLYQGTPLTERSVWNPQVQPEVIYIFQKNIESICQTEDQVRDEIRTTVIHEIGHYFGLDEDQLEVLEKRDEN